MADSLPLYLYYDPDDGWSEHGTKDQARKAFDSAHRDIRMGAVVDGEWPEDVEHMAVYRAEPVTTARLFKQGQGFDVEIVECPATPFAELMDELCEAQTALAPITPELPERCEVTDLSALGITVAWTEQGVHYRAQIWDAGIICMHGADEVVTHVPHDVNAYLSHAWSVLIAT